MHRPLVGTFVVAFVLASVGCSGRGGGWQLDSQADPMSDKVNQFLALSSSDSDLLLEVQCINNSSRVVLTRKETITTQSGAVTDVRFDNNPSSSSLWGALIGNNGLEFDGNTDDFIRSLIGSNLFRVQIQSIDQGVIGATFNSGGLLDAMRPAAKACDWANYFPTSAQVAIPAASPPAATVAASDAAVAPLAAGQQPGEGSLSGQPAGDGQLPAPQPQEPSSSSPPT
jgi:hypothetical protein